ncbi:MAG: glycosyltransferase [Chloroflexi bacterium]|nr:glycosyltransferase [Chloroflexota bacterium]
MDILYVNVIEQHANWGAEYFVNRGFNRLGHMTFCIDYRQHRHQLAKLFLNVPPVDVFLLQRGDGFPLPLIKAVQTPRFFWASELVSRAHDQERLLRSGLFNHVFFRTPACIQTVVEKKWLTIEQCSILLSGFDETVYKPKPETPKEFDILFVGTLTARRQTIIRALEQTYKITLASAFGTAASDLMNRAKIVLNLHAEDFPDTETRVFEALGCGAFLLTEQLSPDNPFSAQDLVEYTTTDDLVAKLGYYLAHADQRETIARHGHQTALGGHTYTHRAQEIVEVMARYWPQTNLPAKQDCYDQNLLRRYRFYEPVAKGATNLGNSVYKVGRVVKRAIKARRAAHGSQRKGS